MYLVYLIHTVENPDTTYLYFLAFYNESEVCNTWQYVYGTNENTTTPITSAGTYQLLYFNIPGIQENMCNMLSRRLIVLAKKAATRVFQPLVNACNKISSVESVTPPPYPPTRAWPTKLLGSQGAITTMAPGAQTHGGSLLPRALPATSGAASTTTADPKPNNLVLRRQKKKQKEHERRQRLKLADKDEALAAAAAAAAKATAAAAAATTTKATAAVTAAAAEPAKVKAASVAAVAAAAAAAETPAASELGGITKEVPGKGSSDQMEAMLGSNQCKKKIPMDKAVASMAKAAAAAAVVVAATSVASESAAGAAGVPGGKGSTGRIAVVKGKQCETAVTRDEAAAAAVAAAATPAVAAAAMASEGVGVELKDRSTAIKAEGETTSGSAETASACHNVDGGGTVDSARRESEGTIIATEESEKVSTSQSAVTDKEVTAPNVQPVLRLPLSRQHLAGSSKALASPATSQLLLPEAQELWTASCASTQDGLKKARMHATK